jgi:hypothetical protein
MGAQLAEEAPNTGVDGMCISCEAQEIINPLQSPLAKRFRGQIGTEPKSKRPMSRFPAIQTHARKSRRLSACNSLGMRHSKLKPKHGR